MDAAGLGFLWAGGLLVLLVCTARGVRPAWPLAIAGMILLLAVVPPLAGTPNATTVGHVSLVGFAIATALAGLYALWPSLSRAGALLEATVELESKIQDSRLWRVATSIIRTIQRPIGPRTRAILGPFAWYGGLAFLATWPLFAGPYLILLDVTSGPHADPARFFASQEPSVGPVFLVSAALDALALAIGTPATLRLVFFGVFFAMAYGMHRLVAPANAWGRYFAGTLYLVNPFVYQRLVAGQWVMALSLAALPFAIHAFQRVLDGDRRAFLPLAVASIVAFSQVQFVFVLAFLLGALTVSRTMAGDQRTLIVRRAALAALSVAGVNLFWIIPLLVRSAPGAGEVGAADLDFFQPVAATGAGVLFELISLYGFWRQAAYADPRSDLGIWWVAPLLYVGLCALAVVGIRHRKRRMALLGLAVVGILGLLIAAGRATGLTAPAFGWAWDHVPFFFALRDSQKTLALTLFAFCTLGAVGVSLLTATLRQRTRLGALTLGVGLIALPLVTADPMVTGYAGQLRGYDYPPEWYEARAAMTGDGVALFLPWTLYMDHTWVPLPHKRIATPATSFFEQPVIVSSRDGVRDGPATDPVQAYIETLLFEMQLATGNPNEVRWLGSLVAPLGVQYVVLLKETDWTPYHGLLLAQSDLRALVDNDRIAVFENRVPVGAVFSASTTIGYSDIGELMQLAEAVPLNTVIPIPGGDPTGPVESSGGPIDATSRVGRVVVQDPPVGHVVLSLRSGASIEAWAWEGQTAPPLALGFLPTAEAQSEGTFSRTDYWTATVPSMVATAAVFAALIALALHARRERPVDGPGGTGGRGVEKE